MTKYIILISILIKSIAYGQSENPKLTISHLTKDFYIYTTYGDAGNGSMYPANGMYLVCEKGVVLFDTPWDTTQFQPLLDSIRLRHNKDVIMCIATHFHADRTAGLNYYKQKNIETYTTKLTDDYSKMKNEPRAENLIYKDTTFQFGQYSFETFYPGKGHSPDNIVIWFEKDKVLYGGCFVKSIDTDSPGNLSDADINEWIVSIEKVKIKFSKPDYIIPGHQSWESKKALTHTAEIMKNYKKKNEK